MGGLYAPFMLGGLKLSSWVKRLLLRQSSVSQAVDTLHTIARVRVCVDGGAVVRPTRQQGLVCWCMFELSR